jgi:integral membrane protein (TIGR00529 family)
MLSMLWASLSAVPVLVKVLVTLALILLANRLVKELLVSVLAGTLLLGLWFGHGLPDVGAIAWERFRAPDNLLLIAVLLLVIWLSSLMAEGGVMRDLVEAVRSRVPRRLAFAALPAVIGFLPMPGGALFSAPMVDSADPQRSLSGLLKTQTNHWFRHIWEYWWPLYPGVILALELTRLEIWQFILVQLPVTLIAAGSGALLLLRRIPRGGAVERGLPPPVPGPRRSFLSLVAPILVVVVVFALLQLLFPGLRRLSRYVPMAAGLVLALVVLQWQRRLPLSAWVQAVFSWRALQITLLVVVVRVYGAVIEAPLPDGAARGPLRSVGPVHRMRLITPALHRRVHRGPHGGLRRGNLPPGPEPAGSLPLPRQAGRHHGAGLRLRLHGGAAVPRAHLPGGHRGVLQDPAAAQPVQPDRPRPAGAGRGDPLAVRPALAAARVGRWASPTPGIPGCDAAAAPG